MQQPSEVIIYNPERRKAFIPAELDEYPLDPYEFRFYCRIARRESAGRGCDESVGHMAEALGISRRRAVLALQVLVEAGVLTRQERGPGMSASYRTAAPAMWADPARLPSIRRALKPTQKPTDLRTTCTPTHAPRAHPLRTTCTPPAHHVHTPYAPGAHKGTPIRVSNKVSPIRGKKGFDPLQEPLPECVTAEAWRDWCQHRREIKKPLTPTSAARQLKALAENPKDATPAIYRAITAGWQGLFPDDKKHAAGAAIKGATGAAPNTQQNKTPDTAAVFAAVRAEIERAIHGQN